MVAMFVPADRNKLADTVPKLMALASTNFSGFPSESFPNMTGSADVAVQATY